ncbi:MAG: hypothetical protein ACR2FY_10790 [Pirellulaceae bacterium]
MHERRFINTVTVSCLLIAVLLPLVLCVAGYFALSRTSTGATPDDWCRIYRLQWQAEIFKPAAKVESAVTGDKVSTYWMP